MGPFSGKVLFDAGHCPHLSERCGADDPRAAQCAEYAAAAARGLLPSDFAPAGRSKGQRTDIPSPTLPAP